MTKTKHDYSLCPAIRVDGEWKHLDSFYFGFYTSDRTAICELRKKALKILCHDIVMGEYPFKRNKLNSETVIIYDSDDKRVVSVFTLQVGIKEEKI